MTTYRAGTIELTNGENTFTGTGTAFNSNVAAGDILTVVDENVSYVVASVVDDESGTLTANYGGVTGSGKFYEINRDATSLGIPVVQRGDKTPWGVLGYAFNKINALIVAGRTWGGITGTLSDQTDLQAELDEKADVSDLEGKADASAVVSALEEKADASAVTLALADKADAAAVTLALADKADQTDLEAVETMAENATITFVMNGGGSTLATGIKGDIEIPFACTIVAVTALADQTGSIVVDVWKDTYANYPPVDADSITASAPVTISAATKSRDVTLTGWTKTITAGDVLRFNVDSVTSVTKLTIAIHVVKS